MQVKVEEDPSKASSVTLLSLSETVIGKKRQTLDYVIGNIQPGETIHFATGAEWSMIDLLIYLLEQTGPADVLISTFEISEFPARLLHQLIEMKMITKLECLLDYRSKERKAGVFQLMQNISVKLKSVPCHAKVTVITNGDWQVCVIGSANYTRNIRIEAGIICTDPRAVEFHHRWMHQELNNEQPFGYELNAGAADQD